MAQEKDPGRLEVVAGIIWRNGKFLAAERPQDKLFAGFWELPGGKMEPGETARAALERELYEELGISCRDCQFGRSLEHFWQEKNTLAILHFFDVTAFHGEPRAREGQKIRWLAPDEIEKYKFLPGDAEILRLISACGKDWRKNN